MIAYERKEGDLCEGRKFWVQNILYRAIYYVLDISSIQICIEQSNLLLTEILINILHRAIYPVT